MVFIYIYTIRRKLVTMAMCESYIIMRAVSIIYVGY